MASVERLRLLPAVDQSSQHVGRHAPETLADEAVEEEVDARVEQRQHVGKIGKNVQQPPGALRGWRRGVEVVEDHEGARRPQNGKNGGDGEENGGGFAGGIAAQTEAAAASTQLAHDDGIEGEEDGAREEVDGDAVGPHQDLLGNSPAAFARTASTFAHAREAVPQLRPPVIRRCRQQTPDVHDEYHSPRARWVGHCVVAQRVTNGDVAIDGQGHGDPDGGVDGGKFQHLHGAVQGRRQRSGQNEILQDEVNENDEEQDEDVSSCQGQKIVVRGLLTTQHQLGQDDHRQDVSCRRKGGGRREQELMESKKVEEMEK